MLDLKGKWVLVTGASRGIGRLAAKTMAMNGCNIILQSRNVEHTASLEEELKALGAKVHSFAADLNDIPSVFKMLEEVDALGVDVDVVLNNAGLQIAYRTDYYQTPAEDYTVSFNVNTIAPAMICYHFLPKMISRGFGRIVNTTSGIDKEGWCRTDLGGPNAPNAPESAIPGVVIGAFTSDNVNGVILHAQDYSGMDLKTATERVNSEN